MIEVVIEIELFSSCFQDQPVLQIVAPGLFLHIQRFSIGFLEMNHVKNR